MTSFLGRLLGVVLTVSFTVSPASRSLWAAVIQSCPTTSGTVISCGPVLVTISTELPGLTLLCAGGVWEMIEPTVTALLAC